jgi:hypothetical protein
MRTVIFDIDGFSQYRTKITLTGMIQMQPKKHYKLHLRVKYDTGEEFWYPYSKYKTYEHAVQAFNAIYSGRIEHEGWCILPITKIRNSHNGWVSYYEIEEKENEKI